MVKEFIIKDSAGQYLGLSGKWVNEYPEAIVFYTKQFAISSAKSFGLSRTQVIKNYGLDTQEIVFELKD